MELVGDSNIIFSALISCKPIYLRVFEVHKIYFPDFTFVELAAYEERIYSRTKKKDALREFTHELFSKVTVIPTIAIRSGSFLQANRLCQEIAPKDIPFVALSLDLALPLWTNDKKLHDGLRDKGYDNVVNSDVVLQSIPSSLK